MTERDVKELHLLRHAKSSWDDADLDDFDRVLAKRGRKAAARMGRFLADNAIAPDTILCSAARRTRETLDLIAPALNATPNVLVERQLYLAGSRHILSRLRRLPDEAESVMVIGHNPDLQELALRLARRGPRAKIAALAAKFPTAALAGFRVEAERWADLAPERCALIRFVVPADLDA